MLKVMGPLAIVSVQLNTLAIDENGIQNTVSIDRAKLAPVDEPPTTAFQRFPVDEDPSTDLKVIWQKHSS